MLVAKLTPEQATSINGVAYDEYGQLFNPLIDSEGDWVVSEIEINNCLIDFNWLKDLPLVEYSPKVDKAWF